jgi:hypothetical protein
MKPIMSKSTDLILRRRTQASLRSLRKLGCAAVSKDGGWRGSAFIVLPSPMLFG